MKYEVPQKTIARPSLIVMFFCFFFCNYALACVTAAHWIISPKKQTHLHAFKGVHEYETN